MPNFTHCSIPRAVVELSLYYIFDELKLVVILETNFDVF